MMDKTLIKLNIVSNIVSGKFARCGIYTVIRNGKKETLLKLKCNRCGLMHKVRIRDIIRRNGYSCKSCGSSSRIKT